MASGIFYQSGGKFHVSLTLPGQESIICKNIGIPANVNFLVPTIEYIVQCAIKGDLGIADSIKRNKAVQNLNKCKSPETLDILSKSLDVTIDGDPNQWRRQGGYSIPSTKISLNKPGSDAGLKAIEKVAVQSVLEQYKPWMEVAKLTVQHLVQIEDIIARLMALGMPSEKPKGNAGSGKTRPKALGYGSAGDMKKSIGKIDSLNRKMADRKLKNDTDNNSSFNPDGTPKGVKDKKTTIDVPSGNYQYQIISTDYSTGVFKQGVDYNYIYIDLESDDIGDLSDDYAGIDFEDNDPYRGMRPESMIFGIYDKSGNEILPTDPITYKLNGKITTVDSGIASGVQGIQKADWLIRTGRWFGNFSRRGAMYSWIHKNGGIVPSATKPGDDYKQQFYIDKDRNIGTDPVTDGSANAPVLYFTENEKKNYLLMLEDIVDKKFAKLSTPETPPLPLTPVQPLTNEDRIEYKEKIMSKARSSVQAQLENMSTYGFLSSLKEFGILNESDVDITSSLPANLINSYMPKKLTIGGKDMWIDPESDYDMKLVKVDYVTKVRYTNSGPQGPSEVDADILRFVKNTVEISLSDKSNFNVDVVRLMTSPDGTETWTPFVAFNTEFPGRYTNLPQFTFDNWNYRNGVINEYSLTPDVEMFVAPQTLIRIWSETPPLFLGNTPVKTWKVGNDNYIIKKLPNSVNWKIGKYEESSKSYAKNDWGTTLTTIDINDTTVTKIKVKNDSTLTDRFYTDNIKEWYYNSTWKTTPPTNWFNGVKEFKTETRSGTPKEVNDPGDVLTVESKTYTISLENNTDPDTEAKVDQYKFGVRIDSFSQTYKSLASDYVETSTSDPKGNAVFNKIKDAKGNNYFKLGNKMSIPVSNSQSVYAYLSDDNVLKAWEYFLFDSKSATTLNNYLPKSAKRITWVFDSNQIGKAIDNYQPEKNTGAGKILNIASSDLPPNQIRLKENNNPFGKLLDPNRITNRELAEDNPLGNKYSSDIYGSSSTSQKSKIKQLYRYMKSEYDTETYYLLEGILSENNDGANAALAAQGGGADQGGGDSGSYYRKPQFLGAIKVFISVITDIFSKLIPQIKTLIALFKNPASFIVEIIKDKLGINMKMFSAEFINEFQQMVDMNPSDRKNFLKTSSIKELVYVNDVGDYRVLFDGQAVKALTLFGKAIPAINLKFGIDLNHKKTPPLKLIFKIDLKSMTENSLRSILDGSAGNKNLGGARNANTVTPSSTGADPNQGSLSQSGSNDSVTIKYSTGKYIEGINYQYIYVTEYVSKLINDGDNLANSGDPDLLNDAMSKYKEALDRDPDNKTIKDKLEELMRRVPNYTQAVLEFLLTIVTAPLKMVADVVDDILYFFTNLNFGSLPGDVIEFISFKWLLDIFSLPKILSAFGIETLPIPITESSGTWIPAAAKFAQFIAGSVPGIATDKPRFENYPTKNGDIDFNKIMSFAFTPFAKGPTPDKTTDPVGTTSMTKDQILVWFKKSQLIEYEKFGLNIGAPAIKELMASIICLVESIINSIIDLFWAILGLEVVIPVDNVHLHICNKFKDTSTMSPSDISNLLNSGSGDATSAGDGSNTNTGYDFIYEVKTSDGKDLKLNREELQNWMDENGDYQYEFLFNPNDLKK